MLWFAPPRTAVELNTRLPPSRAPYWATRGFRLFLIGAVMAVGAVLVVVFEIAPGFHHPAPVRKLPAPPVDAACFDGLIAYDGLLDGFKDGSPPDDPGGNAGPYRRVLASFLAHGETEFPGAGRPIACSELLARPQELRGKSVKIGGLFLYSDPVRVSPGAGAAAGGSDGSAERWVHRTYLVDPSGDHACVIDVLERPAAAPRAPVTVEGVFLGLIAYEAQRGKVTVPFCMGRKIAAGAAGTPEGGAKP